MRTRIRNRGVALVTALLVVAIAASLAASVAFGQQLWLRQMQNMADRARADFLERGAIEWASSAFADDTNASDSLGEAWARPIPALPVPGGAIRGAVEDAQARFNLNNLWDENAQIARDADVAAFRQLLVEVGASPALADSLLDWIDPDSQTTAPGGAEDIDYLQLDPPYRAANQPLASIDELRLVRGFTPEVIEALRPYVTVIPVRTDVNVNTAPAQVIAALIPGLSIAQVEQIVSDRERAPFGDIAMFNDRLPKEIVPPKTGLGVKTGYFLVMLDIVIGRHQRHTEALVARSGGAQAGNMVWHRSQPLILATDETERDE